MNDRGITLIELIIVISIIGILVVALGFEYQGWMGKYRVETQIKQMHTDFTNARARAMTMNRVHFVRGDANKYSIYEDTFPKPDGNRILNEPADCRVDNPDADRCMSGFCRGDNGKCEKSLASKDFTLDWSKTSNNILFDEKGLMDTFGSVYIKRDEPPCCASNTCGEEEKKKCKVPADYDCLELYSTRINMGKWNGSTCDEK